jgi:hypothetical protein
VIGDVERRWVFGCILEVDDDDLIIAGQKDVNSLEKDIPDGAREHLA